MAPSYLYSFEYAGQTAKGSDFLAALPMVNRNNETTKPIDQVAHGDELGYLFDARDVYGNPMKHTELTNASDQKVRDSFTQLIATFVHSIGYETEMKSKGGYRLPALSRNGTAFIKIGAETSSDSDFR